MTTEQHIRALRALRAIRALPLVDGLAAEPDAPVSGAAAVAELVEVLRLCDEGLDGLRVDDE